MKTKEIVNDEAGIILYSNEYTVYTEVFEIHKNKKWYSEEELKKIISELTLTNYRGNPEGYINAQFLKDRLFGRD